MRESSRKPTRIFTVEEANRMLPLVRAIVTDFVQLSQEVIERRQRLGHLMANRDRDRDDVYGEELTEVERDLEQDSRRLRGYVEELRRLGVDMKGPEGLVDFPARLEGRKVYLCWKLGEPEVLYWHELDAGFRGRQPLTADSISGSGVPDRDALG